jgi:hypothetical protein
MAQWFFHCAIFYVMVSKHHRGDVLLISLNSRHCTKAHVHGKSWNKWTRVDELDDHNAIDGACGLCYGKHAGEFFGGRDRDGRAGFDAGDV